MSDTTGLTTDNAPPPEVMDTTADVLAEPATDQAVFDRGYVESIRKEAQRYRAEAQNAQRYEQVFGQYEPQDQEVWFDLARTWATDPARAAHVMQQIATGVLGEMDQSQVEAQPLPPDEFDEGLTPDKVKELIDQQFQSREQVAAEQRAVDNVMAEVRSAGFDPDTAEGFMVLWRANHETGGDIKAAAESVRGYRQQIIDEYVQGRSSGRVAIPTAGGVQASQTGEPITNLEDARRAADRFLQERRGA